MSTSVLEYYESFNNTNKTSYIPQSFSKEDRQPNFGQNINHYYNLENIPQTKKFYCKVCNKDFFSHGMYKKHISDHEPCPFPECNFKASIKVIDTHITHQHMLVNFEELQIDDETWIAERKKRFPTIQRAEIRREQQIERLKRGERLGKDNRKFPRQKTVGKNFNKFNRNSISTEKALKSELSCNSKEYSKSVSSGTKFHKEHYAHDKRKRATYPSDDSSDSDGEVKQGVHRFKGLNALLESTGEVSMFGISKSDENECVMNISDDEEWDAPDVKLVPQDNNKSNSLGSLIGAYCSDSDTEETQKIVNNLPLLSSNSTIPNVSTESSCKGNDITVNHFKASSSFDLVDSHSDPKETSSVKIRKRTNPNRGNNRNRNSGEKRKTNSSGRFPKRRRPTLLEKLLEPNIVHERNVILQCVRYIVENNFFDND